MGIEKPSALMRLIGGLDAVAEIGFGDVIAVNITSEEPKKNQQMQDVWQCSNWMRHPQVITLFCYQTGSSTLFWRWSVVNTVLLSGW